MANLEEIASKRRSSSVAVSVPLTIDDHRDRIQFLDALRGIAILLVIVFHAYARWPAVVPYGDTFSNFPEFHYGWLGVELFFMISGFVIFLTLDKAGGVLEFLTKRWLRLFPAMLICSLFVFFSARLVPERPNGLPTLDQLIPGLTFIDPEWLSSFGFETQSLEGAFWSLYVEVKFYFVAGVSYFAFGGKSAALAILVLLFAFSISAGSVQNHVAVLANTEIFKSLVSLTKLLDARFYGWFAIGAFLYVYYAQKSAMALTLAVIMAALTVAQQNGFNGRPDLGVKIPAILITMLFALPVISSRIRPIFNQPSLLFLGFISYPLYLLHENLMVALTVKVSKWSPGLLPILEPLAPVCFVMLAAWIVAAFGEPFLRRQLVRGFGQLRASRHQNAAQ